MPDETVTVVSYNRPLTRAARKALDAFGIVSEDAVNDFGRWTVVELNERPSDDVLDQHELRVEREPESVFKTDNGERVEIFEDGVEVDGLEQTMAPSEAVEHAEENGWERLDA